MGLRRWSGSEPDGGAVFGDGLVHFPLSARASPRSLWASAWSGWSRMAVAVFGDGLVHLPLARQGVAEVGVGQGVVGLEPDRLAVFGDGLVELPLGARALPRLLWATAWSGWSRIAVAEFGVRLAG